MDRVLKQILRDFEPGDQCTYAEIKPNAKLDIPWFYFPEKGLALYLLVRKLGCFHVTKEEKLHWGVAFRYKNASYALEFRKMGLRLVGSTTPREDDAEPILKAIGRGIRHIQPEIQEEAHLRIKRGEFNVPNYLSSFDKAFEYFRDNATRLYSAASTVNSSHADQLYNNWIETNEKRQQASYYASSAIEVWYSRLEHLLVLMRPFVTPAIDASEIEDFMKSGWGDKFTAVLNPEQDDEISALKGRLKEVKELYRNASSHGGIAKNGASLAFHHELMGPVSISIAMGDKLPVLTPGGINGQDFEHALSVFAEAEQLFKRKKTKYALRYLAYPLTVSYDASSVARYIDATRSDRCFAQFIKTRCQIEDMYANADY